MLATVLLAILAIDNGTMRSLELRREPYNKAAHRRNLIQLLNGRSEPLRRVRPAINYLERESRNASLGRAGEEFVLNFERARFIRLGQESLADRVEHIAVTEGDGAGFDVRSFEADGRDRFIEVKTTAYGKHVPFFISQNEVTVSQNYSDHYHLYRVFRFHNDPRLFTLTGALDRVCNLSPVQFVARIA